MKININAQIIVRPTTHGELVWVGYCATTPEKMPDGRILLPLWEAMNVFGPDCFNGSNRLPFEKNEIEVVE